MPVFKNEDNGTWYVMARYVNWKGERKQKCKRGFVTKKEAQEWERMFQFRNNDISYAKINAERRSCIFNTGNDRSADSRILFSDGNRSNILYLKGNKIIASMNCYNFFKDTS